MSKAATLQRLSEAGLPVPPFTVLSADLLVETLGPLQELPDEQTVQAAPLPAHVIEQIHAARASLPEPDRPVAVRSSLAEEDSQQHSYAGQLRSLLNVDDDSLVDAVRACWASAFSARVRAYMEEHSIPQAPVPKMEVILQEMVPADLSGVLFTVDPTDTRSHDMLVSLVTGTGQALVSGEADGETYRLVRDTGTVEGSGTLLSVDLGARLLELAQTVEHTLGGPRDIEFAVAGGQVWLLQARPITGALETPERLWDNSNIAESYAGVVTPLTRSVIRRAYASVYRQFLRTMGVREIDEQVVGTMLGFYRGRVYYQLDSWYAALAMLPGFGSNRKFMEQMMGVDKSAGASAATSSRSSIALMGWPFRLLRLNLGSSRKALDFERHVDEIIGQHRARDLTRLSDHELRDVYRDIEVRVLGDWRAPIVTDFLAMIWHGALRRLAERWLPTSPGATSDLLAGHSDGHVVDSVRELEALAGQLRENNVLAGLLASQQTAAAAIWTTLKSSPELHAERMAIDAYLDRFGDRYPNELELAAPNLRDDPARLVRLLATVPVAGDAEPVTGNAVPVTGNAVPVAGDAEPVTGTAEPVARVDRAALHLAAIPRHKRAVLRRVARSARRHLDDRERMRLVRARVFGLLRDLFLAVGNRWSARGILDEPTDVFMLTEDEIWSFVQGTALTEDLRGLAALRRAEFERLQASPRPPDRFRTHGLAYGSPLSPDTVTASTQGNLQGIGCSSGRVTGPARHVIDPSSAPDLRGAILVAERTDPGWVHLFAAAAGIVVEHGSPLSHVAIVARELGKPTIVNVPGLTTRVRDGQTITVDGGRGEIWLEGSPGEIGLRDGPGESGLDDGPEEIGVDGGPGDAPVEDGVGEDRGEDSP